MFRFIFRTVLLLGLFGPVALVWASLERDPGLPPTATLDPRMAVQAQGFAQRVRAALGGTGGGDGLVRINATQAELDSAIATVARLTGPLRGKTVISDDGLTVAISGQVPGLPDLGWINLSALVAPSDKGLDVQRVRLGHLSLPPALTVAILQRGLDLVTPDGLGALLMDSLVAVRMQPGNLDLALAAGTGDGPPMFDQLAAGLRGLAGLGDPNNIANHYTAMAQAARVGVLPASGSSLPWIRFAVARVVDVGHETAAAARSDLRAAILALAAHCGDRSAVQTLTGALPNIVEPSPCLATDLRGRTDLRQHFTLSAALAVAGGAELSFAIGEIKELLDAGNATGSGYSFDDIAMDRAGIRFAETILATPLDDLQALLGSMTREDQISPAVADLPSLLSEAAFLAKFGGVDTPVYARQLASIDARIDVLAVHRR